MHVLMQFGNDGAVKIVKRRDAEGRDKACSYSVIPKEQGGVNGCVNLAVWKGIYAKVSLNFLVLLFVGLLTHSTGKGSDRIQGYDSEWASLERVSRVTSEPRKVVSAR